MKSTICFNRMEFAYKINNDCRLVIAAVCVCVFLFQLPSFYFDFARTFLSFIFFLRVLSCTHMILLYTLPSTRLLIYHPNCLICCSVATIFVDFSFFSLILLLLFWFPIHCITVFVFNFEIFVFPSVWFDYFFFLPQPSKVHHFNSFNHRIIVIVIVITITSIL